LPQLPPIIYHAKHWQERAEEARRMAEQIPDPAAQEAMLQVAAGYERLAERAAARRSEPAAQSGPAR